MNLNAWLALLLPSISLCAALAIFAMPEHWHGLRRTLNLAAALAKLALVGWIGWQVELGEVFEVRFALAAGVHFILRADSLALLFLGLSSLLWLLTTVYAIGYLEDSPNRSRFFGFFSLCVCSTTGIALAGNLFSFLLFYELLTLATYPLVVHRGTRRALRAGRSYLLYTLGGGALLLLGAAWLQVLLGDLPFSRGGSLAAAPASLRPTLTVIFALLVGGLAVKAALVPLHGWLPQAMVAPAPVSALLHAVAVVKAGAFGIVRVVYDLYGIDFAASLELLAPLTWLAAATILYGSLRALMQTDLKRRLAYSTVSQVSYIVLGVSLFGPIGTVGGLVHLIHQGLMKVTLFFCAGNYAETLGLHRVDELDGAGRRMPLTSLAFSIAALGMIGLPPTAGFISKWYLGLGALEAGADWVVGVLVLSGLLNAGYFLPLIYRLWFLPQAGPWPDERRLGRGETSAWLLLPALCTGAATLGAGLLAGMPYSPLDWAQLVMQREQAP